MSTQPNPFLERVVREENTDALRTAPTGNFRHTTSQREQRRYTRQQEELRAGEPAFFAKLGAGIRSESIIGGLSRRYRMMDHYGYDPDWPGISRVDADTYSALLSGIDPSYAHAFNDATSMQQALAIREVILGRQRDEAILGQSSIMGQLGYRLMGSFLDPGQALIVANSIRFLGAPSRAVGATNRAVRSGALGAGQSGAIEALIAQGDPTRDTNDVMLAVVFGGALSAFGRRGLDAITGANRVARNVERSELVDAARRTGQALPEQFDKMYPPPKGHDPGEMQKAFGLTGEDLDMDRQAFSQLWTEPDVPPPLNYRGGMTQMEVDAAIAQRGPTAFTGPEPGDATTAIARPGTDDAPAPLGRGFESDDIALGPTVDDYRAGVYTPRDIADGTTPRVDLPPEVAAVMPIEGTPVHFNEATMGQPTIAMGAQAQFAPQVGDMGEIRLTTAESALTAVRPGMAARFGASQVDEVREWGNAVLQDPLLKKRGETQRMTAEEWVSIRNDKVTTYMYENLHEHGSAYMRSQGTTNPSIPFAWNTKAQREIGIEAGKALRRGGVHENEAVRNYASALRRILDETLELAQRHNLPGAKAMRAAANHLPRVAISARIDAAGQSHGIGQVYALVEKSLRNAWRGDPTNVDFQSLARLWISIHRNSDAYNHFDRDLLARQGLSAEFIRREADRMLAAGEIKDSAHRSMVNLFRPKKGRAETEALPQFQRRLTMDETVSIQTEAGTLRFEDLLENNATVLVENYVRSVHGAIGMQRVREAFNAKYGTEIQNHNQMRNFIARKMHEKGLGENAINRMLRRMDSVNALLTNRRPPSYAAKDYDTLARIMNMFNFARLSGGFLFAQMAEFGSMLAAGQLRDLVRIMPQLGRIIKGIPKNEVDRNAVEQLAVWAGLSGSRMRNTLITRMNTLGDIGVADGRIEQGFRTGSKIFGDLSGQMSLMDRQRNMVAHLAATRITDLALGRGNIGKVRMRLLGLDEDMADRVVTQIRRHHTDDPNIRGMKDWNIEGWEDFEAAGAAVLALRRWSTQAIQGNKIGSLTPFMAESVGRLVFQFRNFPVQAWENHLLLGVQRISHGDLGVAVEFGMTMAFAALAITVQQHLATLGRMDRDEILEERLEFGALARASFQRASFSSGMPDMLNALWSLGGGTGQPPFFARNTGLAPGSLSFEAMLSNPTFDLVNRIQGATRGVIRNLRSGEEITSQNAHQFMKLIPGHRLPGIDAILGNIADRFPEPD